MANWWDEAPLADPKARSGPGWWQDAPLAQEAAKPVAADPMIDAKRKLAEALRLGKKADAEIYRTAAFRTNQGVPAAGATDAAINGATMGFGDEISAAARAPIDMLTRGEGYDEAYQHNVAAERDRLDQYRKTNPIASTAAEVAGGLIVPAGNAGAVRTAATMGGLYGAGNSEGDLSQRAADAGVGAVAGGALGGLVSGAGRLIAGRAPLAAPTIAELKAAAKQGYNSEAVTGLEIAPQGLREAAGRIRASLDESGFDDVVATKAHGILKKLEAIPDEAVTVTGRNLHSLQKTLGKAAGSPDPTERAAAGIALRELNGLLEALPATAVTRGSADDFARVMKEANANYSAAMSSGKIDQKLVQAEIRAAASNSGMNVSNTIRQRMADIIANPKLQRGLTEDEIASARQIAEGTVAQNLVRKAGNVMGGGGGIGAALTGGGGYAVAGPAGAAIPVIGMLLKAVGNKMTINQAEKLSESIRLRAPLASASEKFEEKVLQFHQARDAKSAAAAALAARNLATNLRSSGFNVSTGDLMRALQSPAASRANDDQPEVPRPPGQ
jgi:hypothetical protein